ncbi:MAG: HipA N-terminal domain-containing protein [Muribaculaceae bacterium]|nr:HipA N-terminal domain-containing protein [Muribaculaceae bacterium]
MRACEVYVHGIRAGILTEKDRNHYEFEYDKEYLSNGNPQPVSLTLPLSTGVYESPYLFPFFSNMLSEGENRKIQSQLLHIDPADDFGFLITTCEYDTIGAVTIKRIS